MRFHTAIQLYTLRDNMAVSVEETLKAVKEMGYEGVEFAGLFGKSASEMKALCEQYGLIPISAHVPYAEIMADFNLLKTYQEIGCRFVVIPYLNEDYRPGHEKFNEVLENLKVIGAKVKELGMTLAYHNHDFEFVKLGDECRHFYVIKSFSIIYVIKELDFLLFKIV